MRSVTMLVILALGLMVSLAQVGKATPMGTAWTYQGRLIDANNPADGLYDFQFKLYDDVNAIDGNQVGSGVNVPDVDVIDGYFIVELDFGISVFNGDARWLETAVRPGDSNDPNAFVTLIPRQEVTPTPYALQTRGIFVDDSGNVGIGTKFPNKKLTIQYGDFAVYPGHEASIITDGFNVKRFKHNPIRQNGFTYQKTTRKRIIPHWSPQLLLLKKQSGPIPNQSV